MCQHGGNCVLGCDCPIVLEVGVKYLLHYPGERVPRHPPPGIRFCPMQHRLSMGVERDLLLSAEQQLSLLSLWASFGMT